MERDCIDASLGLAYSLELFERYRKDGLLQAEVHHVPGVVGRCWGHMHLVEGKVVSCYLENAVGERKAIDKGLLLRLDRERGPFEWLLKPMPKPPILPDYIDPRYTYSAASGGGRRGVPRCIAPLELNRLVGWTARQKMLLSLVLDTVDGQRTIEDIKVSAALLPEVTEEALRVLLALNVIALD